MVSTQAIFQLIQFVALTLPAAAILIQALVSLFGDEIGPGEKFRKRRGQPQSAGIIDVSFNRKQAAFFGLKMTVILLVVSGTLFFISLWSRLFGLSLEQVLDDPFAAIGIIILLLALPLLGASLVFIRPSVTLFVKEYVKWKARNRNVGEPRENSNQDAESSDNDNSTESETAGPDEKETEQE